MITTRSPSDALAWINRHQVGSAAAGRGTRELSEGRFRVGCLSVNCRELLDEIARTQGEYLEALEEYGTSGLPVEYSRELAVRLRALEERKKALTDKFNRCCT
jgi:hypothetical protein